MTLALVAMTFTYASAQAYRRENRRGNNAFAEGDYDEALKHYKNALKEDPSKRVPMVYNMAYVLHSDRSAPDKGVANDSLAIKYMDSIAEEVVGTEYEFDYNFNRGVIAIDMKDWQTAVDKFKRCMILRPNDLKAKENYIYAKEHLKNDQNGGGGGQDQNQQQDQNKDQQQDQQQDQNQEQQQDQNQGQDQQGGQQPQEHKLSQQAAKQILQAIQEKEKETQDKVEKKKAAAMKSKQKQKNW